MKKLVTSLWLGLLSVCWSNVMTAESIDVETNTETFFSNPVMVPVKFNLAGGSIQTGESLCLSLAVSEFNDMDGFQFDLSWDPAVVRFDSVDASSINLSSFEVGNFNSPEAGLLAVNWFNGSPDPVTLADGTVIVDICFTGIGGGSTTPEYTGQLEAISNNTNIGLDGNASAIVVSGPVNQGCGTANSFTFFGSEEIVAPGGDVCVEISAQEFDSILSFQWSMAFDTLILEYDTAYGVNLPQFDFVENPDPGIINLSWQDPFPPFNGITVPDCEPLFVLCFKVIGQVGDTTSVVFADGPVAREIVNARGQVLDPGYEDGTVIISNDSPSLRLTISDTSVFKNDTFCLRFTAQNFVEITELQYTMQWDETLLSHTGVESLNLNGLAQSDFTGNPANGELSLQWEAPGADGETVVNGTTLYEACFEAIGTGGSAPEIILTDTPTDILAVNAVGDTLNLIRDKGLVNIKRQSHNCGSLTGLSFYASEEFVEVGDQVCVGISAQDFEDILSFQWSMSYDETVLQFDTAYKVNLDGFTFSGVGNPSPGQLSINWFDPDASGDGETVADCETLFVICFTAIGDDGDVSSIDFGDSPTAVEIADPDYNILNANFGSGSVTLTATQTILPLRISADTKNADSSDQVCVDIKVRNFTDLQSVNFSINWDESVLEYDDVQNFNLNGLANNDFTVNAANGTLTLEWNAPTADGVTVSNGTAIFQICFTAIGIPGAASDITFGGNPLAVDVKDKDGNDVNFESTKGTITINNQTTVCGSLDGLSFYGSNETVQSGEQVCVEIAAKDFIDILSFQWTMNYDSNLLKYDTAYAINLRGFTFGNNIGFVRPGVLTVTWLDPDGIGDGETVADCKPLFVICFTAIGPNGSIDSLQFSGDLTSVEVTDKDYNVLNPKFADGQITISGGTAISVTASLTNVSCKGDNNGQIDLEISGGSGNTTFQWDYQNSTSEDLDNLPAGNYSVTISDNGNSINRSYTIEEPSEAFQAVVGDKINIKCFGERTGAISISASGGWGNYRYNWSNNLPNVAVVSDLSAGSYMVTVIDENNCRDTVGPVAITQPQERLRILSSIVKDVDCAGRANGAISLSVTGGTPDYTYTWSANLPDEPSQTGLTTGRYFLTITDAHQCILRDTFDVGAVPQLVVTGIITDADGSANGAIDVTVSGGTPNPIGMPYSYRWTAVNAPGFPRNTEDIAGLIPGDYTIMVTDLNNCSVTTTFTVGGSLFSVDTIIVTNSCPGQNNGSITVNTTGGDNPQISWSGPGGPHPANYTLDNLAPGNYDFTITDGGNTLATNTVTVGSFDPIIVVLDSIVDGRGTPANNGAIYITVTGGSGNFRYQWTGNRTQQDIVNVFPGDYTVRITDIVTGCEQSASYTINLVLPVTIGANISTVNTSCPDTENGSFTINIINGEPDFTITINGDNPVTTSDRTFTVENLAPGDYTIRVEDVNGTSDNRQVTINAPAPFDANAAILPRTESQGGRINLTVSGGTPPYTFLWSNGSTSEDLFDLPEGCFKTTITDANQCTYITNEYCVELFQISTVNISNVKCANDSTGAVTIAVKGGNTPYSFEWTEKTSGQIVSNDSLLTGVGSGTYIVRVFGGLGTVVTKEFVINAESQIQANALPTTNFGGFNVTCFGSSNGGARATVTVEGRPPYNYAWETGQNSIEIDDLAAGFYNVTVTDALNCKSVATVEISEPEEIKPNADVTGISCPGRKDGEIRLFPTGGVTSVGNPYTYQWSEPGLSGRTVRFLDEGDYQVTISDANGCTVVSSFAITGPNEPLDVTVITTDDDGGAQGTAFADVTGGVPPYSFVWRGNTRDTFNNPIEDLLPGFYTVTVTDAAGCHAVATGSVGDRRIDCLSSSAVITPEGDGLNEFFILYCLEEFQENKLEIYNRWGQLVFRTENYANNWSGTTQRGDDLSEGAYFFIFEYTQNGRLKQKKGSFTLLRN